MSELERRLDELKTELSTFKREVFRRLDKLIEISAVVGVLKEDVGKLEERVQDLETQTAAVRAWLNGVKENAREARERIWQVTGGTWNTIKIGVIVALVNALFWVVKVVVVNR